MEYLVSLFQTTSQGIRCGHLGSWMLVSIPFPYLNEAKSIAAWWRYGALEGAQRQIRWGIAVLHHDAVKATVEIQGWRRGGTDDPCRPRLLDVKGSDQPAWSPPGAVEMWIPGRTAEESMECCSVFSAGEGHIHLHVEATLTCSCLCTFMASSTRPSKLAGISTMVSLS